jgi:hypothetical protein
MRLYSNTILTWPQVVHAFQIARLYPGNWNNYYFYRIKRVQPLILHTNSPVGLLQENYQYYCYTNYLRDKKLEMIGNKRNSVTVQNQEMDYNETFIYVPKSLGVDDVIVLHNEPEFKYNRAFAGFGFNG